MLPPMATVELNDNSPRSPNNNSASNINNGNALVARSRASLCMPPSVTVAVVDTKRRSWCGGGVMSPTQASATRRYGEVGHVHKLRNDGGFLEPYLQGYDQRHSPTSGPPSLDLPPCRLQAPFNIESSTDNTLSRDNSRESLSSHSGGSAGDSENSSSGDSGDGYGAACDIGLVERLMTTHPVWFLPGIQRAGAFHLLQGKEEGNFVVRQSSQADTMALSVRLPPDKGPYIEHYLIQSNGRLSLETSENRFADIPSLIAHYSQCCDELPVQLSLPRAIREARTRQQLTSLALLGQEFWRYPMANPRPSEPPSTTPDTGMSSPETDLVLTLNPLMSTFKGTQHMQNGTSPPPPASSVSPTSESSVPRTTRPTPPNTLNLKTTARCTSPTIVPLKTTPPPPPPRWSKPSTPQNNFTVTTTVTFSVNSQSATRQDVPSQVDVTCESSKRLSPEGQANSTLSSQGSVRRSKTMEQIVSPSGSVMSPGSGPSSILSPDTLSPLSVSKGTRHSRRTKPTSRKLSRHYQESDILDSPTVYYRSAAGDKASDYEDIWGPEHNGCSSFKPIPVERLNKFSSPDVIPHGNIISLNNNVISPTESNSISGHGGSLCSTPTPNPIPRTGNVQTTSPQSLTSPNADSPDRDNLTTPGSKQGSPFYAEPADSIAQPAVPRRLIKNISALQQRHSNPAVLQDHHITAAVPGLDRIESGDPLHYPLSSSVDNLSPKQRFVGIKRSERPEAKPVMPPTIKNRINNNLKTADTWTLDNSWRFIGNERDVNMESCEDLDYDDGSEWGRMLLQIPSITPHTPDHEDKVTVQQIIAKRCPGIPVNAMEMHEDDDLCRMSAYDNVEDRAPRAPPSEISDQTEFSEPWPESLHSAIESNTQNEDNYFENRFHQQKVASISRPKSFKERLDPLFSPPRLQALRNRESNGSTSVVGSAIRNYALALAKDKSTTFAQNIENFITCTCESHEINPQIVMRNMRQFMSGMKNYLVKHGERGFEKEVEKERNKLKSTEFLNLDAILEGVLHKLVVKPLRNHLQTLFVDHYVQSGAIQLLAENIQYACTRPISELAIRSKITPPSDQALQTISLYLVRLQAADSPLEKLENLLAAIATIFNSIKSANSERTSVTIGADDFLPIFVWVLVKTNFIAAEIEAEYMWGLLHPSLLSGEGGYYLTTLSSAVHVLKNFKDTSENPLSSQVNSDCSVLKIVVPDELHGSILTKTVPVRPHMTTKQVCKIIAHKARITNPQDYALYRLIDGEENMLADNECPQEFMDGKHVMLAYKRIDAKIAWPKKVSDKPDLV